MSPKLESFMRAQINWLNYLFVAIVIQTSLSALGVDFLWQCNFCMARAYDMSYQVNF
jgi:hypothetical protein